MAKLCQPRRPLRPQSRAAAPPLPSGGRAPPGPLRSARLRGGGGQGTRRAPTAAARGEERGAGRKPAGAKPRVCGAAANGPGGKPAAAGGRGASLRLLPPGESPARGRVGSVAPAGAWRALRGAGGSAGSACARNVGGSAVPGAAGANVVGGGREPRLASLELSLRRSSSSSREKRSSNAKWSPVAAAGGTCGCRR